MRVYEPVVTHEVTLGQVQRWLKLGSSNPNEEGKRTRLRGAATGEVVRVLLRLSADRACGLIVADARKRRMAQIASRCPLGERHLDHDLRLYPSQRLHVLRGDPLAQWLFPMLFGRLTKGHFATGEPVMRRHSSPRVTGVNPALTFPAYINRLPS